MHLTFVFVNCCRSIGGQAVTHSSLAPSDSRSVSIQACLHSSSRGQRIEKNERKAIILPRSTNARIPSSLSSGYRQGRALGGQAYGYYQLAGRARVFSAKVAYTRLRAVHPCAERMPETSGEITSDRLSLTVVQVRALSYANIVQCLPCFEKALNVEAPMLADGGVTSADVTRKLADFPINTSTLLSLD